MSDRKNEPPGGKPGKSKTVPLWRSWKHVLPDLVRRRLGAAEYNLPVIGYYHDMFWVRIHGTEYPEQFATIIQVQTINYALRREEDQAAAHANYQAFLNNQHHPFQWRFSVRPVDPAQLTAPLEERIRATRDENVLHWLHDQREHLSSLVTANHIPRANLYLVLTTPARGETDKEKVQKAARELAGRSVQAINDLAAIGVSAARVEGTHMHQLLWSEFNPDLVDTHIYPNPPGLVVLGHPLPPGAKLVMNHDTFTRKDPLARGVDPGALSLGPKDLEFRRHYFLHNRYHRCVLFVTGWPVYLQHNALRALTNCNLHLDLTLHITPFDTAQAVRFLSERIRSLTFSQTKDQAEGFTPDHKVNRWLEQASYCRDLLEQGKMRWFYTAMYVMVTAKDERQLEEDVKKVESMLGQVSIQATPAYRLQREGFHTCLPLGADLVRHERNMLTDSVANLSPLDCQQYMQRGGFYAGLSRLNNTIVALNVWNLDNYNFAICGLPGKGKTMFERHCVTYHHMMTDEHQLIGDPDGEMDAMVEALGGAVVRLGAGSPHRINAMDLTVDWDHSDPRRGRPLDRKLDQLVPWLEHYLGTPAGDAGKRRFTPLQTARIKHAIVRTYGRHGITPENQSDILNQGRPPMPVLDDLKEELRSVEPDLAESMDLFRFGAMAIFNAQTNVEVTNRLVSLNLRDLDPATRDMAMPWVVNWMWGRVGMNRARKIRTHLRFEEVLSFLENPVAAEYISMIWTRGRKWWCSPSAVTQLIFRLLEHPVGRTILKASDLKVLFDQGDALPDVMEELQLSPQEGSFIRGSRPGDGLYVIGPWRVPFRLALSQYQYEYYTTRPGEMKE